MTPAGRVVNAATGQVIVERLFVANHFASRLRGLQFRQPLPAGEGLLLLPCRSIHTCFVWFALDVVCVDGEGTVVEIRRNVRPWRIVIPTRRTVGMLEVTAGNLGPLAIGDRLTFPQDAAAQNDLPRPATGRRCGG
jgi:uncharacterized membrane protein (UPF0127 family)